MPNAHLRILLVIVRSERPGKSFPSQTIEESVRQSINLRTSRPRIVESSSTDSRLQIAFQLPAIIFVINLDLKPNPCSNNYAAIKGNALRV
jgi:hypothetical protein